MGQLKQKLVHAAMPHTWLIYMLKQKGRRHPTCERRSSQSKKSATLHNKHASGSILNHKANDIHFPSTLKKSSLKACRGEPSQKQVYKQENLQSSNDFETEPGRFRSLYRCTMSPTSRKICAGTEVTEMQPNAHDHLIMPHTHALHGDPSHLHIASKKKNFKLNVEELEMKLNALSSEERWRNTYISPSLSVAVPSPSLDGALDYSSYPELDSAETSLRHPLRGGEWKTAAKRNSDGISPSTLYCSSGADTKWSVLGGGDCFTTMEEHPLRDFPAARHMGYSKGSAKEARSRPQLRIGRLELHDNHRDHGRRSCMTSLQRKASKNSPKQSVLQFNASPIHNDFDDECLELRSKLFRSLSTRSLDSTPSSIATTSSIDETCFESPQLISSVSEFSRRKSVDATPACRYRSTSLLAENVHDLVNIDELVHPKKGLDSSQESICSIYELESKRTKPFSTPARVHHHISCAGKFNHWHHPHAQYKTPSIWNNATRTPSCTGAIGVHDNYGEVNNMQCQSYRSMKSPTGSAPNVNIMSVADKKDMCVYNRTPSAVINDMSVLSKISSTKCSGDIAAKPVFGHAKTSISRLTSIKEVQGTSPANNCADIDNHLHGGISDNDNDDDADDDVDECKMNGFDFKFLISPRRSHELTGLKSPLRYKSKTGAHVHGGVMHPDVHCGHQGSSKSGQSHQVRRSSNKPEHGDHDKSIRATVIAPHDIMQGGKSENMGRGCHDYCDCSCILNACGIVGACGYQASGESDEDSRTQYIRNYAPEESKPDATSDGGNDEMISSDSLDTRAQLQQKRQGRLEDRRLKAEVMWSYNMHRDFKKAMVANIVNMSEPHNPTTSAGEARLLELLQSYLALNRRHHHPSIIKAFCDVCENLNQLL